LSSTNIRSGVVVLAGELTYCLAMLSAEPHLVGICPRMLADCSIDDNSSDSKGYMMDT
jgi:hypothetical protein